MRFKKNSEIEGRKVTFFFFFKESGTKVIPFGCLVKGWRTFQTC